MKLIKATPPEVSLIWETRRDFVTKGRYSRASVARIKEGFETDGAAKTISACMLVTGGIAADRQIEAMRFIIQEIENDSPIDHFTHMLILEALQFFPSEMLDSAAVRKFLEDSTQIGFVSNLANKILYGEEPFTG